ncbi:hypothetical protein D3C86_2161660 [compost metagenome]
MINVVVKSSTEKKLKLRLYDSNGRLTGNPVEVRANEDINTTAVPVNYLQSGFYIYTLTENNKVVFKGKIIKK